jgi:hypothetical protein
MNHESISKLTRIASNGIEAQHDYHTVLAAKRIAPGLSVLLHVASPFRFNTYVYILISQD